MFLISVYFNLITLFNRSSSLLQFNLADFTPDLQLLGYSCKDRDVSSKIVLPSEFLFLLEISCHYYLARGQSVLKLAFSEI